MKPLNTIMLPMAEKHDSAALRQFAWQMAIAFPLFFALLLPWLFDQAYPLWPWYVSVTLLLSAFVVPIALYPLYVVWMIIASLLGWTNTVIILGIAFFLLIMPIGLILRGLNKLGYHRKLDPSAESYWIDRTQSPTAENLKEPF
ncbi:SxtJ family membrane protein [Alteromonas oceanisediminis]|uniref:SxtJ family membrane protein n=1 Tax=Alteromonas oceanisediminis TaxID=2836180 RepID=UPI001BDB3419|nr:SxtJ family membrane protein [Alteromonas oceanisediminis]MBT0586458.1 hypothetical protein [Alteromonas oceanisediminis]